MITQVLWLKPPPSTNLKICVSSSTWWICSCQGYWWFVTSIMSGGPRQVWINRVLCCHSIIILIVPFLLDSAIRYRAKTEITRMISEQRKGTILQNYMEGKWNRLESQSILMGVWMSLAIYIYVYIYIFFKPYIFYVWQYQNTATCGKSGARTILASLKRAGTSAQDHPK